MLKLGILISGRGSNMQSLIAATRLPDFPAEVVCVIANRPDAAGIKHAQELKIPAEVIDHKDYAERPAFEHALDAKLKSYGVQLVCLAGFMRLLTSWFVGEWRDRLVNIHPSLLPAFPGLHTHQAVLDYGAKFTGCTVHFVRPEMDHGPIIAQAAVPVAQDDTEESLAERVLKAEHVLYPRAVRLIAEGRVNVIDEKIMIVDNAPPRETSFNPDADR